MCDKGQYYILFMIPFPIDMGRCMRQRTDNYILFLSILTLSRY